LQKIGQKQEILYPAQKHNYFKTICNQLKNIISMLKKNI